MVSKFSLDEIESDILSDDGNLYLRAIAKMMFNMQNDEVDVDGD